MYHKEKLSFLWYKSYSATFAHISTALLRAGLKGQAGGSAGEREL